MSINRKIKQNNGVINRKVPMIPPIKYIGKVASVEKLEADVKPPAKIIITYKN